MRPALAETLGGLAGSAGASRVSKLGGSLFVVHSDLHNHSIISGDALGDPDAALAQIRDRGIDVACLTEHAVSYGHWTFLRILWETEGLTQRRLSAQAGVMEPTTFSALNAMERLGYVVRRANPRSRKEIHVYLTAKGRALKSKLVPLAEEVNEVALREVAADDIAATRRTLLALIANLAADETASLATRRRMPSTRELARLFNGSRARPRKTAPHGRDAARAKPIRGTG